MSAPTVTEREAVLREREAFVKGTGVWVNGDGARYEAARRYPLPKVTRPRVVRDTVGIEWRVTLDDEREALIGYRETCPSGVWRLSFYNSPAVTPERVRILADLIANPTEEVEEDAP